LLDQSYVYFTPVSLQPKVARPKSRQLQYC